MESLRHGCIGAAQCAGTITALRCLLARKVVPPNRLALAVGAFVGSFRIIESYERLARQKANSRLASLVASSLAFLIVEEKRQATFVSYATMEAIAVLAKQTGMLTQTPFIEIYVGIASFGRIIYTWIYEPHLFAPSHLALLDKLSGLPELTLKRMREELPTYKAISRCDVFHRGESCLSFHTRFILDGFQRAMKIYVPIYLLYSVVLKYKRWIWGPRPSISGLLTQYFRTCTCLTLSYEIGVLGACALPLKSNRLVTVISGMATTLCLVAENAKRRASVLKAVSVYSVYTTGVWFENKWKLPKRLSKMLQWWLFVIATMTILRQPELQNARVMQFLYGYKMTLPQKQKQPPQEVKDETNEAPSADLNKLSECDEDSNGFVNVDKKSLESCKE